MSDLKPCPFCGGEVDFWTKQAFEAEDYQALIIDCKDCPANMEEWVYKYDKNFAENFEKKKTEMFEAWNRRIERIVKVKVRYRDESVMLGHCECGQAVGAICIYCPKCGVRLEWE